VLSANARVNALQLPGFREAMALPDQAEQMIGLRTQQVLMHETGIARYGDIFEGSKIIEKVTAEISERARAIALNLREVGYARAISLVSAELTRLLTERQRMIETGEILQVGVNAFTGEIGLTELARDVDGPDYAALERDRIDALREWRVSRDQAAVASAQERLDRAVTRGLDTIEPTIELARTGGTVGEWTTTIERATHGRYTPPILDGGGSAGTLNVPKVSSKIRVALGKAGLDGHVNAVKLLAHACMQAGMEVILAGFKQTPAQLVETALQEDADVLAISSLAGAHMTIAREVIAILIERGADEMPVVLGGIIPEADRQALLALGVKEVFTPKDSNLGLIISRIAALGRDTA
jgi:ethylmalonyl-CoA mutase